MTYTHGEQVLRPKDVEYLFRAIKVDLSTVKTRIDSLRNHFAGDGDVLDFLDSAGQALLTEVVTNIGAGERKALGKVYPHRLNAGEHEHW